MLVELIQHLQQISPLCFAPSTCHTLHFHTSQRVQSSGGLASPLLAASPNPEPARTSCNGALQGPQTVSVAWRVHRFLVYSSVSTRGAFLQEDLAEQVTHRDQLLDNMLAQSETRW